MAEFYVGMIFPVAFSFAPTWSMLCQGQLLAIASNTALFSLIGTYYGGDGRVTFQLPDLQGNLAISAGQAPGLSLYQLGEAGGTPTVTLNSQEMAAHNHSFNAAGGRGATPSTTPANTFLSDSAAVFAPQAVKADSQLDGKSVNLAGGSQPHNNMMPFVAINWCIVTRGLFPSFQ